MGHTLHNVSSGHMSHLKGMVEQFMDGMNVSSELTGVIQEHLQDTLKDLGEQYNLTIPKEVLNAGKDEEKDEEKDAKDEEEKKDEKDGKDEEKKDEKDAKDEEKKDEKDAKEDEEKKDGKDAKEDE